MNTFDEADVLLVIDMQNSFLHENTARASAMRDLDVTVLADCCTTYSVAHQASALEALEYYMFARVSTLDEASADRRDEVP